MPVPLLPEGPRTGRSSRVDLEAFETPDPGPLPLLASRPLPLKGCGDLPPHAGERRSSETEAWPKGQKLGQESGAGDQCAKDPPIRDRPVGGDKGKDFGRQCLLHPVGNDPNNSSGNPGTQGSSQPAGTFHVDGQGPRLPSPTFFFRGGRHQRDGRKESSRAEVRLPPPPWPRKGGECPRKQRGRDKAGSGGRDHLVGHKDRTGGETGREGSREPRKEHSGKISGGQQAVEEAFARRSGTDPDDRSPSIGPLRESRSGTWQRGSGDPCRR